MEMVEILRALRHCTSELGCDTCPMRADVERRTFCVATLLTESKTAITDLLADIDAAKRRCAQAQAERDALLTLANNAHECTECKNCDSCERLSEIEGLCGLCGSASKCPCYGCGGERWEWRGLPEAPEEGEKEDA